MGSVVSGAGVVCSSGGLFVLSGVATVSWFDAEISSSEGVGVGVVPQPTSDIIIDTASNNAHIRIIVVFLIFISPCVKYPCAFSKHCNKYPVLNIGLIIPRYNNTGFLHQSLAVYSQLRSNTNCGRSDIVKLVKASSEISSSSAKRFA